MEGGRVKRMNIEIEKIQSYINYEAHIPEKKVIFAHSIFPLLPNLLSFYLKLQSQMTSVIMMSLVSVIGLWGIYLTLEYREIKQQEVLYLGVASVFMCISFLLMAYNLISKLTDIPYQYTIIMMILYFTLILGSILNVVRLIKKGYYLKSHKTNKFANFSGVAMYAPALIFSRILAARAEQDTIILVLVTMCLILGLMISSRIHNLIKYFFMVKYSTFSKHN